MRRIQRALLALLVVGVAVARAEELPYKRTLQGDDAQKAAALQKQIDELWAAAKFDEAVNPAEELRALRQRVQGEKHWEAADTARQVETLGQAAALSAKKRAVLAEAPALQAKADALHGQAKYAEAEALFRNVLAVYEEVLGPHHPDTATSYNNLALNLDARGHYREAEPLYRQALAVRKQVLGPRHPDTARSCNNLASNLDAQGRSKEAEPLFRQALAVFEEVLGPRHPDTAASYYNLAANLETQGRSKEAEPLHRKAVAVREEVLGPRHPDTIRSYHNLAANQEAQGQAKEAQGQAKEAEPLYRNALAIWEELVGPRHPDTARSYLNLAANLEAQGRYKEAEPLYRQALAVLEEALGPRHSDTATNCNNLAYNLQAQGRVKEAEQLLRQVLAVREEVLGPRHPDTAQSYNNLAYNLQAQGRAKEAEQLLRQVLAVREEVLGPRHPDTAQSYNNLAYNLDGQGRYKEAEPLLRQARAVLEKVLGPRHPDTAASYNNLAGHLQAQGRAKEAEQLYRQALAVWEEVLGPLHRDTAASYNNLAYNLQAQGRYKEAEPVWQAAAKRTVAARLRLAAALDRAAALSVQPHVGLAACRARLGRPTDAWDAAEAGLARSLLDDVARTGLPFDVAARAGFPPAPDPDHERQDAERTAHLAALDRLLPHLLIAAKLDNTDRRRRDDLLKERADLDDALAKAAAERFRRAVLPLDAIQARLAPDAALVFWVDLRALPGAADADGEHWGCVVRHAGPPAWVRLPGSGRKGAWTTDDDHLPHLAHDDLARGEPAAVARGRRLAAQRLEPLAPHLAPTADLPAVSRLVVVPTGRMAGIPVEALTDRYLVSYAPSGSIFALLRARHRPLVQPTLLALGDPTFVLPEAGPPPEPPDHGLYLSLVLPGGAAARAGLHAGNVLLRYAGTRLTAREDLKVAAEGGAPVRIVVWRDGQTLDDLRIAPGKLGVVVSSDPPAVALRKRHDLDLLADARTRADGLAPLPGTRLEVAALAGLLPEGETTVLLGSKASEQELDALRTAGKLKDFRFLHLATHGTVDPTSAAFSALELARDRLPGPEEQAKRMAAGEKVYTGRLSVATIAKEWQLDADLVTLSACETALGPDGGGEGLLGFSQVLLGCGARSLLLSLWKVDDTATALLMLRFYQNLLGMRDGLPAPLPKAEALREAKSWLRSLPRAEAETLAGRLARGSVRAKEEPKGSAVPAVPALPSGEVPFAQPRYWAAFILIGDPD
jgi:tetratricopeptide (TPR) repeat protein